MTLDEQIVEKMTEVQLHINASLEAVSEALTVLAPAIRTLATSQMVMNEKLDRVLRETR